MRNYERALSGLDLPMHLVKSFTYLPRRKKSVKAGYYEIKSKGPFLWGPVAPGMRNVAPWVSFLGSQVRFDGETRIRQESIDRHVRSLGRVTAQAIRELEDGVLEEEPPVVVRAWYSRLNNRLIRKGVGYVTAKYNECIGCWAAAFGQVTKCRETQMQMRRLDHIRENMLTKVRHLIGPQLKCGLHRFKGNPYSYHAFLLREVERPTNMRPRRQRVVHFRYSDL